LEAALNRTGRYFFFASFVLLSGALFTAAFFGFLVSLFCALLPLAMIPSWRSPSISDLAGLLLPVVRDASASDSTRAGGLGCDGLAEDGIAGRLERGTAAGLTDRAAGQV
jgi:hypothetical protein